MNDISPVELAESADRDPFSLRDEGEYREVMEDQVHVFRGHTCDTERRGRKMSRTEIILDASDGFIPLWHENVTLHWRFQERSVNRYRNSEALKAAIRALLREAITKWGEACPISFKEDPDVWDFEIVIRASDECTPFGCTLASAFFPDEGQHEFVIYPKMFEQDAEERLETMIHELGHIFGLRHFFALTDETAWEAVLFGAHDKESIMNYGDNSRLTDRDRSDLKRLYQLVRSGTLTNINRTPFRLMNPFSARRSGAVAGIRRLQAI